MSKSILLIGGAGFIGLNLAVHLRDHGYRPYIVYNSIKSLCRPASLGFDLITWDEIDTTIFDAIVLSAFDYESMKANVNMVARCIEVAVSRRVTLIYLGSMARFGEPNNRELEASSTYLRSDSKYAALKAATHEYILMNAKNVDWTILDPGIVVGPFGGAWVDKPIEMLATGNVYLTGFGMGTCPLVDVSYLCKQIKWLIDNRSPLVMQEAFIVSGVPILWKEFFQRLSIAIEARGEVVEIGEVKFMQQILSNPSDQVVEMLKKYKWLIPDFAKASVKRFYSMYKSHQHNGTQLIDYFPKSRYQRKLFSVGLKSSDERLQNINGISPPSHQKTFSKLRSYARWSLGM